MSGRVRLGVNIDHVATIRNARGVSYPDPVRAAIMALEAGADGVTAHLREDRRHISDDDIARLAKILRERGRPLNLEMAVTAEMLEIALQHKPHAVCLVPERREERTTEGGLDVAGGHNWIAPFVEKLRNAGSRVSLFIGADPMQIEAASRTGAQVVELHTGAYCDAARDGAEDQAARDLKALRAAATQAASLGLEVHAGHGIDFETVAPIAAIPEIAELNIGHFLVGEAIFTGLAHAVADMRHRIDAARAEFGLMIIGIGSDIIDIRRIEKTLARFGDRFVSRIYTDTEKARAERRPQQRAASYAKRFAAKEATSKALGTGLKQGVFWRDMGVANMPSGQPTMRLTGGAAARLAKLTPPGHSPVIHVTLTDDYPLAVSFVIISAELDPIQPGPER